MLDDESGTATEDEEDVRARELRKQEVWLKMPPRNSDTDTGSETEVNSFLGSVHFITTQESLISPDFKIIPSNMDTKYYLSDKYDYRKPFEFSREIALISSDLAVNTCNQSSLVLSNKNDISPVISQTSECITRAADSTHCLMTNNDDDVLIQNEFPVSLTNIAANNCLTKDVSNSEDKNFIDKNICLNLNDLDNSVDCETLRNEVFVNNMINFDFTTNVSDFTNVNNIFINSALALSTDDLRSDIVQDDQNSLKQIVGTALTTSCTGIDKDPVISNSENNLIDNKFPDVITSLSESRNSLSSSSSEIYRSTESLHSDTIIKNNMNDPIDFLESNLSTESYKYEHMSVINKDENFIINKNKNIISINDSNNIQMNDIIDKEINALTIIPTVTANMQRKPIITVTSPSPTQEKQFEELSVQTVKLMPPQNSHIVPSFVDCHSSFDKLKQDLKQRKAKNKTIGNELKPLSTECAQVKINKYFMKSRKPISESQLTWNKETKEAPNVEIMKLDIKPKLSSKINTEKILKYFNNSSFPSKRDKYKTYNITKAEVKQNDCRKLEIDVKDINDMNEKEVNAIIDKEFKQIEEQSEISHTIENNQNNQIESQYNLPLKIRNGEEKIEHTLIYDDLNLLYDDFIELHPESNVHTDYANSQILTHNIRKLYNYNNNVPNLNTELGYSSLKIHTAIASDVSTPLINESNNIQTNVTNKVENMKKIDYTDNTLEDDVENIYKKEEINVNLSSNMLESAVTKEDAIKINLQNNIVNNIDRNKQTIKINCPNGDKNEDKKFSQTLSLDSTIHFNGELTTSLLLKNNTNDIIKDYMLQKSDTHLSKSDTSLNKSTACVGCKNINNSKSLFDLRNIMWEIAPVVKVTDIKKMVDVSNNIKDVKVTNNNSTCIIEVPKESGQIQLSPNINVSPKSYSIDISTTSSYTESALPKIPVRRKIAKKRLELLNQNQDVKNTSEIQNPIIEDVTKSCGLANNNVFNIQNQDIKKHSKIISQNVNIKRLQNQNINNVPENQTLNIFKPQNCETKDILKQPSQDITKLQNQHITSHGNFNNKIVKDDEVIMENWDVINASKIQSQNETVPSVKRIYHLENGRLSDKLEKPVKLTSKNNQSKKDKCVVS